MPELRDMEIRQRLRGFLVCALASVMWLVPSGRACAQGSSASPSSASVTVADSQPLHVGDIIRLKIWREPDLSGDFAIPTDGQVVFPKVGVHQVLHETPSSLRDRLIKEYSESLVNPSIDVMVLYRVNVLGSVKNPGLYTADATMSVPDLIALAGGVAPDGDARRVQLLRGGVVLATQVDQNKPIARNLIQSGDQLYVPQQSWFARNSAVMTAALVTASAYLLTTLLLHR
jgi:polysaccharide biosynthesis/export protein